LIIIALVMALVTRWRRQMDLITHLHYLTKKSSDERALSRGQLIDSEREVARLQAQIARLTRTFKDEDQGQRIDQDDIGDPAK
jgi:hypothetical protein